MNKEGEGSCLVIGDDGFTINCAEILLSNTFHIKYLISKSPTIARWCHLRKIQHHNSIESFLGKAKDISYSYLISASNGSYIPQVLIDKATILAINYHNSLLPKYAGINAPTWAILNGEKTHGITWHTLTSRFDEGDIVEQVEIDVDEDETAEKLNYRCCEAGLIALKTILEKLKRRCFTTFKQNKKLRTYYSYSTILDNDGAVIWGKHTAEYICRLNRSVEFGDHDNLVGTVKIMLDSANYLIVESVKNTEQLSCLSPGTIVSINEEYIEVSTITNNIKVRVTSVQHPNTEENLLKPGMILPTILVNEAHIRKVKKREVMYSNTLKKTSPHLTLHSSVENNSSTSFEKIKIYSRHQQSCSAHEMLLALITYIWHTNNQENFVTLYSNILKSKYDYFYPLIPIEFTIDGTNNWETSLADLCRLLANNNDGTLMSKDLFHRIAGNTEIATPNISIIMCRGDFYQDSSLISDFNFIVDAHQGTIHLYYKRPSYHCAFTTLLSRMSTHIENIINCSLSSDRRLANYQYLTTDELNKLARLGRVSSDLPDIYHKGRTLSEQINTTIKDAIFKDKLFNKDLSYETLHKDIERIALAIYSLTPKPKSKIAVIFDRSNEYIVTIVSVLQLGFSFIPIDKSSPKDRVEAILDTSNADLLISDFVIQYSTQCKQATYTQLISKNQYKSIPHDFKPLDNDIAYVIFTSGSTGKPKGVSISHKNVLNYIHNFMQRFNFTSNSIMDFSCSISFDLSIPCIFVPLLSGGRISICSTDTKTNPRNFISYLDANKVSHVELTPSYFNTMISCCHTNTKLDSLQYILLGAEALSVSDILRWHRFYPKHRLVNEYGPTEATVAVSSWNIDCTKLPGLPSVPIGEPFINTQFCVLNKNNQIVPLGGIGELCIHGEQVSHGYINNPTSTLRKFVNLSLHSNELILDGLFYKTGDLVRWDSNGLLYFLGRIDAQSKLHGYRINYHEIESTVTKLDYIQQAVVTTEGEKNNEILVCYVVSDTESLDKIPLFLAKMLPTYYIPSKFYRVPYIPLKSTEKIDFLELSRMLNKTAHVDDSDLPASIDSIIEVLRELWKKILLVDIYDDSCSFFEYGGGSFTAVRLINEVNMLYEINLTIEALLEYESVSKLARYIFNHKQSAYGQICSIVRINMFKAGLPYLFLIHPVGGSVLCYRELAKFLEGKVNVYGIFDPSTTLSKHLLYETASDMVDAYEKMICDCLDGDQSPISVGGASFGANLALSIGARLLSHKLNVTNVFLLDGWKSYPIEIPIERFFSSQQAIDQSLKNILITQQKNRRILLDDFVPELPSCNITLYKAKNIWPEFRSIDSKVNNWGTLNGCFRSVLVDGDHETMLFQQEGEKLAAQIAADLAKVTVIAS